MPWRPTISAPLGKSGPLIRSISASCSSSRVASGCSSAHCAPVGDLAQVVRRDVGGHADRDAGRAVDQQVGEARRQDRRLLRAAVVVGLEVDGVLVDVADHLHRQRRHPALGVAHRGRGVVARRAEVALAVDQRRAHHPRLREPDQGVVDRGVAVRVVLTHDVTDDARALGEAAVGPVAAVVHRVEHPAVHRLEAVAYVGQRAADDDRHRVVDVGALHRGLQLDRLDPAAAAGRGAGGGLGHDLVSLCSSTLQLDLGLSARRPRYRGSGRPWRCAG